MLKLSVFYYVQNLDILWERTCMAIAHTVALLRFGDLTLSSIGY